MLRVVAVIASVAALGGCYYTQAASGQLDVLNKREPIDEVIAAPETPGELARKLGLVSEARQFAVDALYLPDNDSYRSYADIGRDYVVWNVFAAPEFSLQPRTWCFPIAGCVAYRGYFAEDSAVRKAERLRSEGYDVVVGGVPAYSTLGRFDDPVLNTMMHWDDVEIVATIFHELAHQLLYVKGDTEFNESFATAVAEIGLGRWLQERGESEAMDDYLERRTLQQHIAELVNAAREDLEKVYASALDETGMRQAKQDRLNALGEQIRAAVESTGRRPPAWTEAPINNARLVSVGLYLGRVREFHDLYAECDRDLACFYERASSLPPAGPSSPR